MLPTVRISSGNWLAMLLLLAVVGVFASELSADSDKFDRATRVSPMGVSGHYYLSLTLLSFKLNNKKTRKVASSFFGEK